MRVLFLFLFCIFFISCVSSPDVAYTTIASVPRKVEKIYEKYLSIPIIINSSTYTLEAKMYCPNDSGNNHPIAIVTHGRNGPKPERNKNQINSLIGLNRALAYQGYIALYVVRRGYGNSDGPDSEYLDTPEQSGLAAAQDIKGVIEYLHTTNIGDSSKIVIIGQSQGGWVALASSTENIPGVLGTVNISGAINFKNAKGLIQCSGVEKPLERSAGLFGEMNKVPVFWLYAKNDNHSVKSVNQWFTVFHNSGGNGCLYFTPEYKPVFYLNGHSVVNRPDYYFTELLAFFESINFVN